jgi:hypothetical protein
MPIIYKWEIAYTLEEVRERAKLRIRERAKEIPALLKQKEGEYV